MSSQPILSFIEDTSESVFISYTPIGSTNVHQEGPDLLLSSRQPSKEHSSAPQRWRWNASTQTLQGMDNTNVNGLYAVLDRTFSCYPRLKKLYLIADDELNTTLALQGLVHSLSGEALEISSELFWQSTSLWLNQLKPQTYPLHYTTNQHPLRPKKTTGVLYRRFIPWLNTTFSIRNFDLENDLVHFSRWMNDPRVAYFWEEQGTLEEHGNYIKSIASDPHNQPLIGCFDDIPFAYFEAYWAKEDRIGPFYDVKDFDRGWHLLVGESAYRGRQWFSAWFPSLQHYLFLDDTRTQHIVAEPRHDNEKLIGHAESLGFDKVKEFDFPHKRAQLIRLSREQFFSEQRIQPLSPESLTPF